MVSPGGVWIGKDKLVLASRSRSRSDLLATCGIAVDLVPADIDEREIEAREAGKGMLPTTLARRLSSEKALCVSRRLPGRLVLGADQVLDFEDRNLAKSTDLVEAREKLRRLSAKRHRLISAAALARDGIILFETIETAELQMRELSPAQIDIYLGIVGESVLSSVGAYQVEGMGRLLFERIEGDQAVILGLPLTNLLGYLRSAEFLAL